VPTTTWPRRSVASAGRTALADSIDEERAAAVRSLLAAPLLDADIDRDAFGLVVRHAEWLVAFFEDTSGWTLTVDAAAGFARLAKRPVAIDTSRTLCRTRGSAGPFDRRRYQLLCLVCAELVRHPVTTIGLLSASVTAEARLDTSRHGERSAFVDALRALIAWGALRASGGEVDAFVDTERANAILTADTARLHRLLVSATAASALPAEMSVDDAIDRLAAEPRYGEAAGDPASASDELRNRWARHRLGRRLLDDPVTYGDELSDVENDYLASLSGRRWLRDRALQAGFELEERAEGFVAVDPHAVATDIRFPAPMGNAHQLALLLVDRLAPPGYDGRRTLGRLRPPELRRELDAILARFPAWARGRRDAEGPDRLLHDAVDVLVAFGLAAREADGAVVARPAIARYRPGEPVVAHAPSLFEEEE